MLSTICVIMYSCMMEAMIILTQYITNTQGGVM